MLRGAGEGFCLEHEGEKGVARSLDGGREADGFVQRGKMSRDARLVERLAAAGGLMERRR